MKTEAFHASQWVGRGEDTERLRLGLPKGSDPTARNVHFSDGGIREGADEDQEREDVEGEGDQFGIFRIHKK